MRSDYTTHSLRHMLSAVTSTAATIVLFLFPMSAGALSCAPRVFTLSEAYETADSIIVGLVTECMEAISGEPWANGGSECSFASLEVLKEARSARDYRGVASSSGCGLSLHVGNQYLLFLDSENRPLHFSASLNDEQYPAQLSKNYVRILREFRDGVVRDLSEPWIFGEHEGTCLLSHNVGGHQITFSRLKADAAEQSTQDWTRETIDGKTIYRGSTRSGGANSTAPPIDFEVVVVGDIPEYPIDTQMLTISLPEQTPAPVRQATVTVGSRSWPLYRVEESVSIGGMPANTQIGYRVGGEVSEQILSAMSNPSDVLVSALLVNSPNVGSEPPPEPSQPDQGSVIQALPDDVYFSQTSPEAGLTKPAVAPSAGVTRAYRSREEPPEPVLRLETRSTQLPAAAENFRACYGGVER